MEKSLIRAARAGDRDHFDQLVREYPDAVTPHGNTALHLALRRRYDGLAEYLCTTSPSLLSAANDNGDTCLHVAAKFRNLHMASFFLRQLQASPSRAAAAALPQSMTLDVESGGGGGNAEEALIRIIKMQNRAGNTALHEALINRESGMAVELLRADPGLSEIINNNGQSVLFLAVIVNLVDVAQAILRSDCFDHRGPCNQTALHAAVRRCHPDIAKILLEKRPGIANERDNEGSTPLHIAAERGEAEMVRVLLGFDISAAYVRNNDGKSPVHLAVGSGHVQVIQEFIERCSDCLDVLHWHKTLLLLKDAFHGDARKIYYQTIINKLTKDAAEQIKSLTERYSNNTIIAAILIATVAFVVALTVSGGYKSNTG